MSSEAATTTRLYRGLTKKYKPEKIDTFNGTDFTDCPRAARCFAKGRYGELLVLDVPSDAQKHFQEATWVGDGTGPQRLVCYAHFDRLITAVIPGKDLRAQLRGPGMTRRSDEWKASILEAYIEDWIEDEDAD